MSTGYKGNSEKPISSKYLYAILKNFKSINDNAYADKDLEHSHTNKTTVLDKFSVNEAGELLFNGTIVNSASASITNHISDNSIHMSVDEKKTLNSAYQKPTSGIPKTDLTSDLQTEIAGKANTSDIISSETKKVKETLMDYSGVDHFNIKNIGTMSHDELEQIIDNHVSNTVIHQTKSLGQMNILGDDFLAGVMSNCVYNSEEGYIELVKVNEIDRIEYTTDEATYTSKILNTGIENCPYVTFSWLGKYNSDYTNIIAYIRYGSVSIIDDTWTDWEEIPYDKTITGTSQYCQAKIIFKTSDKFKNIIIKNIVIYYGIDMNSELTDARTDLQGTTHSTLKMRLDNMEGRVAKSTELGLVKPEDKLNADTDYTAPVKVDKNGKLYSAHIPAIIDKTTNTWVVEGIDTGISYDMSKLNNNIELLTTPTEKNHIAKLKNILDELYVEEERFVDEHYTLSETASGLVIVADGSLTNASTQVELSTVNNKLLHSDTHIYAVGEYVTLTVREKYRTEKYCTKDFVKDLIGGDSNIHQLSFLDVKTNDVKYLDLEVGNVFTKSLIQAFKFIPGESNIVETLKSFNNADASNFNFNDEIVEFTDKGMGIKDTYKLNRTKYDDGLYITEAFNKDDFVDINTINI